MPTIVVEFHMIVLLKLNQPVQGQHPPIMQKAFGFLQILKTLLFKNFTLNPVAANPLNSKGYLIAWTKTMF